MIVCYYSITITVPRTSHIIKIRNSILTSHQLHILKLSIRIEAEAIGQRDIAVCIGMGCTVRIVVAIGHRDTQCG